MKKILMFINEMTYSGVPIYAKYLCELLKDEYQFEIWSLLDGEYRKEFKKIGVPVSVVSYAELESAYCGRIDEFTACIVHSAFSYRFYQLAESRIPTIWYIHEGKLLEQLCNKWKGLRETLNKVDKLVCVSQYSADIVKKLTENKNVEVIHNISFLQAASYYRHHKTGEKIRFLSLGTLEKRKGIDVLLDAVEMFSHEERKLFSITIAGRIMEQSMEYAQDILKRITQIENVKYAGYLTDRNKVMDAYQKSDVLVVASRDEASSLVALEAASQGMAIILTDSVGAKYLNEGTAGVIKSENPEELFQLMKAIIENPEMIDQMGRRVLENYKVYADSQSFRDKTIQLIEELCRKNKKEKKIWTVVIRMDGISAYLYQTIQSIMAQDIEQRIQILVIAEKNIINGQLADKLLTYGSSISVMEQECVLDAIEGDYFTICSSGTIFDRSYFKSVLLYFQGHRSISVLVSPLLREQNGKVLQNVFYEKSREVDCIKNPEIIVNYTDSVFYRSNVLKEMDRSGSFPNIDLKNLYAVIIKERFYGIAGKDVKGPHIWNWEERQKGMMVPVEELRKIFLALVNQSIVRTGNVSPFLQMQIADDIKRRLSKKIEVCNSRDLLEYIMSFVDDARILNLKGLSMEYKIFWLRKKYGEENWNIREGENGLALYCGEKILVNSYIPVVEYQFARISENKLEIEGYVAFPFPDFPDGFSVLLLAGDNRYLTMERDNRYPETIWEQETVYERKYFKAVIPLVSEKGIETECCICVQGIDRLIPCTRVRFARFFPVSDRYKKQYCYRAGWKMTIDGHKIKLVSCTTDERNSAEEEYEKEIKNTETESIRQLYITKNSSEKIWLIWDRIDAANDNGEALFHYLFWHPKDNRKCYFVIHKHAKDYKRLKKLYGEYVIAAGSNLHKRMFALADRLIGSQTDSAMWALDGESCRDIVSQKPFVFLQHGITKNDMSKNYSRYWQNIQLFVTAAKPEYECTRKTANYGFDNGMVQLLGFPRYDLLEEKKDRIIAVIPTWRQYCMLREADGTLSIRNDFEQTEYFNFYYHLLSDQSLWESARRGKYKVVFMQHPMMKETDIYFESISGLIIANDRMTYRQLISTAALLVTDYSSVSFDFAYLEKPVLYCQFDQELFYATHTYQEGYFDYERDGFGEVAYNFTDAAACIREYMRTDCTEKDIYRERAKNFFGYRDKENCKRVAEAIERMDG